jgi:hypothetical protein
MVAIGDRLLASPRQLTPAVAAGRRHCRVSHADLDDKTIRWLRRMRAPVPAFDHVVAGRLRAPAAHRHSIVGHPATQDLRA